MNVDTVDTECGIDGLWYEAFVHTKKNQVVFLELVVRKDLFMEGGSTLGYPVIKESRIKGQVFCTHCRSFDNCCINRRPEIQKSSFESPRNDICFVMENIKNDDEKIKENIRDIIKRYISIKKGEDLVVLL